MCRPSASVEDFWEAEACAAALCMVAPGVVFERKRLVPPRASGYHSGPSSIGQIVYLVEIPSAG